MGTHEGRWDEREDRNDADPGCSSRRQQGRVKAAADGGRAWQAVVVAPWKLPLVVTAIAVPIVAAFYVSPGLGLAAGALAAVAIVVVAARQRPRGGLGSVASDPGRRLLVVVSRPLEEPGVIREIADAARKDDASAEPAEVLVLAPAQIGFLDRWASDVEGARREAQRRLVIAVASLARAGVAAEARVGDEDVVQAVEDQLQSFAASEVILVTGSAAEDPAGDGAAAELERRLRIGFRQLTISGPAAR
jgi:hypothetical protein